MLKKIVYYQALNGKFPFRDWLAELDSQTRARIRARVILLGLGNAGDYRCIRGGLFEMRLHFGPGYRVYFGYDGKEIVLLLLGGDKSSQSEDIVKSFVYWGYYQERKS